jgi:hypothetical protein
VKRVFRPFRKDIEKLFDSCLTKFGRPYSVKKHYWTDDEMAFHVTSFMVRKLGMPQPTKEEVWCVMMLVYPSKGKTEKKKETYLALDIIGKENMEIFKVVFDKPNMALFKRFFENNLIRDLWVLVAP